MESAVVGSTKKKKFLAALLTGFIIFGSFLAMLGFSGTVFALPLGGMGDFYVTFDELEGEGFTLNPEIGETGNEDEAPLVRNEMKSATIEDLRIYKDLKLPTGNWVRINIEADQPSKIEGLIQDARFIDADLSFDNMGIKEKNTSAMSADEAFRENWTQDADNVRISDAKIVTDYLFQNMVTLNGAKISLESIDEPDQRGNSSGGTGDEKLDNDASAAASKDDGNNDGNGDGGKGDLLPSTAGHWLLPIIIGVSLAVLGTALLLWKRRLRLTEEE